MKSKLHSFISARGAKRTLVLLLLMGLVAGASAATENSVSEMLEKGIYSEESKGDIDAAMKLYEQVVTEAKAGQSVAAQAQYRLGVCYYKKKNYAEATAAFEKLTKDYPDQKELIARAHEYLSGAVALMPAPWADGEEMRLDFKFPSGFRIGMVSYGARGGEVDGHKIWRLSAHTFAGVQSFSQVEVEADSFKPLHSRWKHNMIGDVDAVYTTGHVELRSPGKDDARKVDLEGVIYDNEEAIQLMRRLPLAAGYQTSLRFMTSLGGGNIVPVKLEVTGPEKVEVPAGTFDCFKVELSIRQTFWYSTDGHRYLVKMEAGGAIAELTTIQQPKAGEPVSYQDPTLGFSLTAPAEWGFYRQETRDEKAKVSIVVLDPEAMGTSLVEIRTVESLKPEAKKSLRDWADLEVADAATTMKDFQVRADSWKDRKVAGSAGVSFIGDFLEGKDKKIGYGVFTQGATNATRFLLLINAKEFDAFRPKFDAIVDSYKAN